jgi:hypothetical protein
MPDLQRVDPNTRRTAVMVVVIGALVGLALIAGTRSQLNTLQKVLADNPEAVRANVGIITWALIAAVVVPVWAVNVYLWRLGSRSIRSGIFPPPGIPVIRDMPVLRDNAARKCGRVLQILAAVMSAVAAGFAVALWRLAAQIQRGPS